MNEQLKPFQQVLVRADGYNKWLASFYSHYDKEKNVHICTNGAICTDCIPYEGNEHLLGTTDSPQPKRWRADKGGEYWYVGADCQVLCTVDRYRQNNTDDARYNIGNYFRTREEAEIRAEKFRKILN